jgi:hypothetical protein
MSDDIKIIGVANEEPRVQLFVLALLEVARRIREQREEAERAVTADGEGGDDA